MILYNEGFYKSPHSWVFVVSFFIFFVNIEALQSLFALRRKLGEKKQRKVSFRSHILPLSPSLPPSPSVYLLLPTDRPRGDESKSQQATFRLQKVDALLQFYWQRHTTVASPDAQIPQK